MNAYALKRVALAVPTLLLVVIGTFLLVRLVPGDVLIARIGESGSVTPGQLDAMREELGLNDPLPVQFIDWFSGVLRGDFGESLWTGEPVWDQIAQALEPTIILGMLATLVGVLIAIPMGVISAVTRNSPIDYASRLVAIGGISLPDFWVGLMVIIALSRWFGYYTGGRYVSFFDDPLANLELLYLPALILGFRLSAGTARITRSAMLEVLNADYVRTARSKGLRERTVVVRHALRNALIPIITVVGAQLGLVVGGTVIMESLFAIPGMGNLTLRAVTTRDYPQLQANVLVLATFIVSVNIVVDLCYGYLDPRIRVK
ncbi:MAG: ABC transporter permease [Dehalococcoidia bacterium]